MRRLIVADASPLITLAAADALNCLTLAGLPVVVPDMVYAEVARDLARLGAAPLVAWVRAHPGQVEIAPTEVYAEYEALLTVRPDTRSRGRGEAAALEVLADRTAHDPGLEALLLFEDSDIRTRRFALLLPERVLPISTGEFLLELQAAGRIQSADKILSEAAACGRRVARTVARDMTLSAWFPRRRDEDESETD